jgi:(heptosyl)LPS beta-1,4-glucosyltransferase
VRLGGFVIHGNSAATLARCLASLRAVCDEVVAVDSDSNDGSAALCAQAEVRSIRFPWRGFGAARAEARRALEGCDYIFYLDSDEWLEADAVGALREWRETQPRWPIYSLRRRDWADIEGRRFIFRVEHRARLLRADVAAWDDRWIVHEAVARQPTQRLPITLEHGFARSLDDVAKKQALYALLWAIRVHGAGKRSTALPGRRLVHALRDAVWKGALFRGGLPGWQLAYTVGRYHALKHQFLAELWEGRHAEGRQLYAQGRYAELFAWAAAHF